MLLTKEIMKEMREAYPEMSCFNDQEVAERMMGRLCDFNESVPEDEWTPEEIRRIKEWLPSLKEYFALLRKGLGLD